MEGRALRIALTALGLLLVLTVPQTLAAFVTVKVREASFADEFFMLQLRLPAEAWSFGGLPGYLFWVLGLSVPATFAFFPSLRRWGAAAAGLLLGVAAVAGAAPKAFVGAAFVLAANLVPQSLELRWPSASREAS